jgi:hypothetical protein
MSASRRFRLPAWASAAALHVTLVVAWLNFLLTAKWANLAGALNGWKRPLYAAALTAATIFATVHSRKIGRPVTLPNAAVMAVVLVGVAMICGALLIDLPPSTWHLIPFDDDWVPLFQTAVDGVHLLQHGVVVGWNWSFLGGYPTSTNIAQSVAALAFLPMTVFGERIGYHLVQIPFFLAVPVYVWWDMQHEGRQIGLLAAGFACLFAAGYFGTLFPSGDTNSLAGVFSCGLALVGSRAARLGRRGGGPVLILGLTAALYSHVAFFVYALIYLVIEAAYFRDRRAALRLVASVVIAAVAALPVHWESLRYPSYVSIKMIYDPHAPVEWPRVMRTLYYNVEILALPHRWFNDYRSLTNVWMLPILVVALQPRSRAGFYACAALGTQAVLRLSTYDLGALPDRMTHMLPMLVAPALAGFVLQYAGTRAVALSLIAVIGLYVQVSFQPIRHVPDIRAFDAALIDHLAGLDGNLVLVEISPHRSMDSDPRVHSVRTPFNVHFEGLLPGVAGQRFYSQMFDGWVWNTWRGQVVGAGTFRGRPIAETPIADFDAEMRRWGVRHLLAWTDQTKAYLAGSARFVERWRNGRWAHYELLDADVRSVVTVTGRAEIDHLDPLGADVQLANVVAGDPVLVRTNYYPAWRAESGGSAVALYAGDGQLAFRAPETGTYTVRLTYPRYRALSIVAAVTFIFGMLVMSRTGARAA